MLWMPGHKQVQKVGADESRSAGNEDLHIVRVVPEVGTNLGALHLPGTKPRAENGYRSELVAYAGQRTRGPRPSHHWWFVPV